MDILVPSSPQQIKKEGTVVESISISSPEKKPTSTVRNDASLDLELEIVKDSLPSKQAKDTVKNGVTSLENGKDDVEQITDIPRTPERIDGATIVDDS